MDFVKAMSSITVLCLALCALIKEGVSITCYMCNSAPTRNDHLCATLTGDVSLFEQNCDYLGLSHNVNYTVCRKMHQTIYANDGSEEERVIRQCGTDSPLDCSWRTRPNTLQVETCHCDKDLCNTAPPSPPNSPTLLLLCIAATTVLSILPVQTGFFFSL